MNENRHRVLCVDDEKAILQTLRRSLRKEAYRLLTASSAGEGLEILDKHKVNLVISDQRMPGMTGTEFLERVREKYPDIFRVILTGYTDMDSIKEAINKGHIYKFFLKPCNIDELKLGIRDILEKYDHKYNMTELNRRVVRHVTNLAKREISKRAEIAHEREEKNELRNRELTFSYAILQEVPIPIVGVDYKNRIVLMNQEAIALSRTGTALEIGRKLSDCLSEEVEKEVSEVIANNSLKKIEKYDVGGDAYDIEVAPLGGDLCGKGAFLKFALKSSRLHP